MFASHLQQISLSAEAIAELPFPPPKIFTNALLHPHDITALIRDTEAHERALFTFAQAEPGSIDARSTRKSIATRPSNMNGEDLVYTMGTYRGPRPTTAVGRTLGGDMMDQIRKGTTNNGHDRAEVDVELLLRGAEKLCGVYPIQGAMEKIESLRIRHEQLTSSIEHYEARIAKQSSQLERMNRRDISDDELYDPDDYETLAMPEQSHVTAEDVEREEEEMQELEKKKQVLADRIYNLPCHKGCVSNSQELERLGLVA